MNKLLDRICTSINLRRHKANLNYWKTLMFNLRAFPLGIALKFPVYVYGSVRLTRVGTIHLPSQIKRGMITIGEDFYKSVCRTSFMNWGEITFKGACKFRSGTHLYNAGKIVMGDCSLFSENCYISILEGLTIGDYTEIGFGTSITDTNDHYTVNIKNGEINRAEKSISIGKHCWIGSNTYIKKGAKLPDFVIVASPNAMIAKDYTKKIVPYSIIGGAPASLIKEGFRRVKSYSSESTLRRFFTDNPNKNVYQLDEELLNHIDDFCID